VPRSPWNAYAPYLSADIDASVLSSVE